MDDLYIETIELMRKYNIKANKNLGQNFLISEEVLEQIINIADVTSEDIVIEIGPGLGSLTKKLLKTAKKVICIELDKKMIKILENRFNGTNLEIINQDVLKTDLQEFCRERVKIVANLPYYITTPIIMKLLEEKLNIESITVMVQKEVAKRLTAKPGTKDTGAITYAINYYTIPEYSLEVSSKCFIPSPEVDSAVIKLNVLKEPSIKIKNEEIFFKIIKLAFGQRRKTLSNALETGFPNSKKMLEELGIEKNRRGETLTLEEFAKIERYLENG